MTMHSMYYKEHEEVVHNPVGHLSSASAPWWSVLRTPLAYGESVGQLKSLSVEDHSNGDQFPATKFGERATKEGLEKGIASQFTIFPGGCKSSTNGQKPQQPQAVFSTQAPPPDYRGCFELGLVQPMIATYPYGDQCYGALSTYGPQIAGRVMLPLNLTTDDGPIFVNAKQYHGILRRRKSRAKAELKRKVTKNRKPFLHLSRHLHAMRRPRGCGGRFLNTKKADECKQGANSAKTGGGKLNQSTGSPNSEVLQSDISNLTSPREANHGRSTISGSEVTSMFTMEDLNHFPINNLQASFLSLSDMMSAGHGIVMPSKWVAAAADSCCNLNI